MSAEKHALMAAPDNTRADGRTELVGLSREEMAAVMKKSGHGGELVRKART